jgi:hypothetical protein
MINSAVPALQQTPLSLINKHFQIPVEKEPLPTHILQSSFISPLYFSQTEKPSLTFDTLLPKVAYNTTSSEMSLV